MAAIRFEHKTYQTRNGETVLDTLLGAGISVPHACRSGSCQTCLMRATKGSPPATAQKGLKQTRRALNFFLACVCTPEMDMEVTLADDLPSPVTARVITIETLARDVLELTLTTDLTLNYRPGQFIHIKTPTGLIRSYSLASVPEEDDCLRLHIRRVPGGQVSGWIHEHLKPGDTLTVQGPMGDCFYCSVTPSQALMLIGTGTGLAPLYGIVRDALRQGHTGPIHLFHGSHAPEGVYLQQSLHELASRHPQVQYTPCLSGPDIPTGFTQGRVHEVALSRFSNLSGWRVFLCGHPGMVEQARMMAFIKGAAFEDIHADPFTMPGNPPENHVNNPFS